MPDTQQPSRLDETVLCSGTLGRISFAEKVDAAAAAGFAGLSIYFREADDPEGLRRSIADAGLFLAELDGPMDWLPGQDGPPAPSVDEVVERAAALEVRSITVVEITGVQPALDAAVDAFANVCDLAAQANVLVHIEPFPWSGIRSFGFAADIVAEAGCANGGILLDTWHLFRGPDSGALPHRLDPATVLALQLNDVRAAPGQSLPYEAMHDRLLPGTGAAAERIRDLMRGLRAGGCTAPLGVEVFSDELAALPAREIAHRAFAALENFRAGITDE